MGGGGGGLDRWRWRWGVAGWRVGRKVEGGDRRVELGEGVGSLSGQTDYFYSGQIYQSSVK